MRILLDTHILLWVLSTPERLDADALATIRHADNDVLFSAATIWEIAIKAALRRADFPTRPGDVLEEALDVGFIELPVRAGTACRVAELPLIHRDPFDRILVAQAIGEPAVLFTADPQLVLYSELVRPVGARAR
jgi:PIN domain nuclease of toxin-antitoxin system